MGHEATRTGAPVGFLSLMTWWKRQGGVEPLVWLRHGGPLAEAHAELGPVAVGEDAGALAVALREGGVHLAYLNTATLGAHAALLHEAGVPVICHAHEMDFELGLTGAGNLERLARSAARFVACSEAVRESLQRCAGVAGERIVVAPECVDVERALRLAGESAAVELRAAGRKLLCGMGTVGWRKGVDFFLRALAHLAERGEEWHGVWIGDLDASAEADRLRHDVRVLNLEGRVTFTGSLANPFAVLAQADVFCLTSREDPYPLAMVEAAALGLPVIGFRGSGGVEEFAAAGGAVVVGYGDARAMAEKAVELAGVAGAARREEGAALARRLCAPEVVGARLLELMREVAAREPVRLGEKGIADLAAACAPGLRVRVELRGDASERRGTFEGDASERRGTLGGGGCEVVFDEGVEDGFEMTLQPLGRSVLVSGVEVFCEGDDGARRRVDVETRSAGRAVRLGREDGGVWLLLDGQGRLILRGRCGGGGGQLGVRWRFSTDVKGELASRLERGTEAKTESRSVWRRLGLK